MCRDITHKMSSKRKERKDTLTIKSPKTGRTLKIPPLSKNEVKRVIKYLMEQYEPTTSEAPPTGVESDLTKSLMFLMLQKTYDILYHAAHLCVMSKRRTIMERDVLTAIREHRSVILTEEDKKCIPPSRMVHVSPQDRQ